jgi:hypothetical protein
MDRYRMPDGTILRPENAIKSWTEDTRWDGHNNVSINTGSQWKSEMLYKSRKGRYWVEHTSGYQGTAPHAEWVSEQEAARWLLFNGYEELPEDLIQFQDELEE